MIFDETITNGAFNLGMPIEYFKGLCASPLSSYYLYRESTASISPIKKEIQRRKQMKLDTEKRELEITLESMSDKELELMSENEDLKEHIKNLEKVIENKIAEAKSYHDDYWNLRKKIHNNLFLRLIRFNIFK